jgi:tetratricopeptide (TPR) repeat protein/MinD-like ATPase involved in chromosome partitioning or flagellar assembly
MALANVAWILAANGKRVLVVDWDLESPGLFRFFSPFINPSILASTSGVIELIREYEWATTRNQNREEKWHERYASVEKYCFSLEWKNFPGHGSIDYLSAGQQNSDYVATLAGMNWDDFYEKQGGGRFFDAMRSDMKQHYDYTLIDSRTGLSDVADICTIQLPDVLVDCFTLSEQGIDGSARVARMIQERHRGRNIRILPVQMRVDPAEKAKADAGRTVARQRFGKLPLDMTDVEEANYWSMMQVPYQAYYNYEESLATFADVPGSQGSLLSAYETLTSYITRGAITSLPPMDETTRSRIISRFERRPTVVEEEVSLRYAPEDQVWAEWIENVLKESGMRVHGPLAAETNGAAEPQPASARVMIVISQANVAYETDVVSPDRDSPRAPLAVYVADVQPLLHVPISNSAFIAGIHAVAAAERILSLVGRGIDGAEELLASGPRYPGDESEVFNVPARNARFTGREDDLARIRRELRSRTAVVLSGTQPVALQGMGGIGKTQLATEYAHRFRSSYDVVWWINAELPGDIEGSLVDLGGQLGLTLESSPAEAARTVLQQLSKRRWLLILDNAEDPDSVQQFTQFGGRVLITSRNPSWGEKALAVQVDVFRREESVEHLRLRVPSIRPEEADQIAELLGDLPIAISAAAAWLYDTGTHPEEYLRLILSQGPSAVLEAASGSVERTWDLSLSRLRERSTAAYRLFQLCSVLGPEISLELVYSDELAECLKPYDSAVSERMVRGSLVQQINRLALLRIDQRGQGGQGRDRGGHILVHRVVQHVVRSRMTEDEVKAAQLQVQQVLASARPDEEVDDPQSWHRFRLLWPHLDVSNAIASRDERVRRLFIDRIRYQWIQGDLGGGLQRAEYVVGEWEQQLNELSDPAERRSMQAQLLHLRFNLANILRDRGQFADSKAINEQVLREQQLLLAPGHPHLLMTAGGLAGDLRGLGRYREAMELDLATYRSWLEEFGEEHPRTLAALNNLAACHRLMGNFRDARESDEIVYQIRRKVLGETHFLTLGTAGSLARDIRDAGEYERSAMLLRSAYRAYVEAHGPSAKGTLMMHANLAVSLRSSGHIDEALRLLEEVHERLNDRFGPDSPDTLTSRLSMALSLLVVGQNDRAARELQGLVDRYTGSLGTDHPHTLVCYYNLSIAQRVSDRKAEALKLARQAMEGLDDALGSDHPYTLSARMNFAICRVDTGSVAAAADILADTIARMTVVLGPLHPNTLRCRGNLALVNRRLGLPDADSQVEQVVTLLASQVGATHTIVEALRLGQFLNRTIDPHPF